MDVHSWEQMDRKVISVSFSAGESRRKAACFTALGLQALCQSWEAWFALPRPSKTRQHLVWVREAHFLVRLQGRLPLHIVLQRLTGDLVVERSLSDGQALSKDAIVGSHKCCLLVTDISVAMGI